MGLSTISYLRSIYPNSKIYYGIRAWTAKLYENIETDADGIIPLNFDGFSNYLKTWKSLSDLGIDHIHELHLSGRSKKFFSLYSMLKSVKYTFHNHHLDASSSVLDHGKVKPLIQRDLDGAYTFLGDNKEIPSHLSYEPAFKISEVVKRPFVIFGVVATRQTKMWKNEYFVELGRKLKNIHPDIRIIVPLSMSEDDIEIKQLISELDLEKNLEIVHIPLEEIVDTFKEALLYIGNDTGLKHIAIAAGVKSYTFFGPEPPLEWHPYDDKKHPYFYIDGLECRTRDAHYCGLSTCDSMICLDQIEVGKVFEKVRRDIEVFFE